MVTIGVTGHRVLADLDKVEAGLEQVVARLEGAFPEPWTVVSALAEGADRLVARRLLERPGTRLVAVLPLPRDEYTVDFASEASREEFAGLLAQARQTVEIPDQPDREHAYEAGYHAVLELADVLIAVWDGRDAQGRGGTGGTVTAARERGIPLAWIRAGNRRPSTSEPTSLGEEQGRVTFERCPRVCDDTAAESGRGPDFTDDKLLPVLQEKFPHARPETLEAFLQRASLRRHDPHDILCHQGEREERYSVIVSGQVDVFITQETGRAFVTYLRSGGSLGGLEYITRTPRVADVVASEPVVLLEVSFDDLTDLVVVDPEILREVAREVVEDLIASQSMFMQLSGQAGRSATEVEVFISYARTDLAFAKKLTFGLHRFDVAAWLDVESIRAGGSWARQIGEALDRCAVMVLVLSPASMSSENSDDEWNYFLDKRRPVIPVLFEQTERPYRLNKLQYVDFTAQPFDSALTQLVATIRSVAPAPEADGAVDTEPVARVESASPVS